MVWTNKHTILVGVLALGGSAVGVDHFFLRAPAPSPAIAELVTDSPSPAGARAQPMRQTGDRATPPALVARLLRLQSEFEQPAPESHLNAFAIPVSWPVAPVADAASHEGTDKPSAEVLAPPAFRLSLIRRNAGIPFEAVINNVPVRIGESVNGYTLVMLSGSSGRAGSTPAQAILDGPAGRVELALEQGSPRIASGE